MPPNHAAGTVKIKLAIQFRKGACSGIDNIAHTVSATWTTPIITACSVFDRPASHAVT